MELPGRWKDLETILNRSSNLAGPDFEPGEHLLDFLQVRCGMAASKSALLLMQLSDCCLLLESGREWQAHERHKAWLMC